MGLTVAKKTKADIIPTTHACEVKEEGYYWARLVVWVPPTHLPQKREFPMLCKPCIVELWFSRSGKPHISANLGRRERVQDWWIVARVPDYEPTERHGILLPEHVHLLSGPKEPAP